MNIKVGDKVKIPAGTRCSTDCYFDHYRANGTYEGVVKELTPNHAQALVHYTHTFLSGFVVRNAWVAVKDLIKVEEPSLADDYKCACGCGYGPAWESCPACLRPRDRRAEPPFCEDKPIELTWRVIAIRAHESDDTKAEITITGGESETVDGAVYLTVTREEAKAIHLGDVYVVSIRKKG